MATGGGRGPERGREGRRGEGEGEGEGAGAGEGEAEAEAEAEGEAAEGAQGEIVTLLLLRFLSCKY